MKRDETKSPSRNAKRPYQAPRLRVYGTVSELTLKVGDHGPTDGGNGKSMTKTKP
jgi:hypothetical protein